MTAHTPKRRTVLKAGAWAAPTVLATTAVPAYAASFEASNLTDMAIELTDPSMDWSTFTPVYDTPIYRGPTTTSSVAGRASFPKSMIITNVGSVPAVAPSGTLLTDMQDVVSDGTGSNLAGTYVNSTDPLVTFTFAGRERWGTPTFTWSYAGTLQPNESVEIPLRYYVNFPFWNVQYELFVAVTVIDEMDGDSDDNFEHMGVTQGRVIY
ncbi:hypothetical protein [Rothia nasimurium]|uniref:hypothetical protein n=1 Tax=Rothia nasimurium TaxID=85336 RepID=UPI001F2D26A2|nr:hypothetical protein [Rothia nasimurium]